MATNITAITDTVNSAKLPDRAQFQALFSECIPFSFTGVDATNPAQGGAQCDVDVSGAALGDFVLITPGVDNNAQIVYAQVTAANVVTVTTFNVEGTDADTSFSGTPKWYGVVLKRSNVWP
jgi:hypothetical protein